MNFLSHYFLLPEKSNADFVAGNLLPDLMRGFSKIYRQEIKAREEIHHMDLVKGIHFHLHADKLFHNHEFFELHCDFLKVQIEQHHLPNQRSYIVSHVLLELLIDQYLMEQRGDIAPEFYNTLEQALKSDLDEKIKMTLNQQNTSRIISIFKGFTESKYAFSLLEDNGVQQALYHIIGRRIGITFNHPKWQDVIEEGRNQIDREIPSFLKHLNQELNDA